MITRLLLFLLLVTTSAFAESYPVQMGLPLECGKLRNPVVKGVPTQTTVTVRCPDGTARHAILNFVLEDAAGQSPKPVFVEGPSIAGPAPAYVPDLSMSISTPIDGKTYTWNAKDLPSKRWIDGPIATTMIYGDPASPDQFRPEFIVTRWHTLKKTKVRYVGENTNSAKVAELWTSVRLFANGVKVFEVGAFPMPRASRWSKQFWLETPPARYNLVYNLSYLTRTRFIPNYDTSINVSSSAIAASCNSWNTASKDLTPGAAPPPGNWQKAMGAGGGRADIGPYPTWVVLWLYTGQSCLFDQMLGNADLAASWPMHFRQPNGKYYNIEDNPFSQLLNLVGVTKVGDTDSWGWNPDLSHQPAPFYVLYLVTGDPFYLEQMLYWASYSAAYSNGAAINSSCGRGPTGKEGGFPGDISCLAMRGTAWAFRNRAEVAFITPDSMVWEKAYFTRLTHDAIKIWEGQRSIGDMNDPLRAWGQKTAPISNNNPLNWWDLGNGAFVQSPLDVTKSLAAISTWEQNFIRYALYRALDLGYPTERLIAWSKVNLDGVMSVDYRLNATYRSATRKKDGTPYAFGELPALYEAGFDLEDNWLTQTLNGEHGYGFVAIPAGDLHALNRPALLSNPKWAILPR